MKIRFITLCKDTKGTRQWSFQIKTPNGRLVAQYDVLDAVTYPEAQKRVRAFLKTRQEPEVAVVVL